MSHPALGATGPSLTARLNRLLVAPGASTAESALGYGAAVAGAVLAATLGVSAEYGALQVVVLTVLGFDLFGGAVVNATAAAERRFHAPRRRRRGMVGFVAAHLHLFAVALLFPGYSWWAAGTLYTGLVVAAVVVTGTGDRLRRPVAFGCAAVLLALSVTVFLPGEALAWIAPVLVVKLLLAHLLRGPAAPE